MKKFFGSFLSLFFIAASFLIYSVFTSYVKVLKVVSPVEIYVDFNKNFIFDEETPVKYEKIFFIDSDHDYSDDLILKNLSNSEKFFLHSLAVKFAFELLNNKFVEINNNNIFINGKNYSDLLLDSGYFYVDDIVSKQTLVNNVKNKNIDDNYVIYNYSSHKIHKPYCSSGQKSKKFAFVKRSDINTEIKECPFCFKNSRKDHAIDYSSGKNIINVPESSVGKSNINYIYSKPNINVYFTDLNNIFKPDKNCRSSACRALKNEIDNSKVSLDMALYGIENQPEIVNSLLNASKRGVKIRFVYDYDKTHGNYYKDTLKLLKYFSASNSDEDFEKNVRSSIMHNKFIILDNHKVWTGSANITDTDLSGFNSNISLLIASSEIANIYKKEFEQMLNGKFHSHKEKIQKSKVKVAPDIEILPLFSPADNILRDYIVNEINNAKKYIFIPVFFITSKDLISPLTDAFNRGVDVRIIDDATNSHNKYSIHKILRQAGIKVKTENYAGKLHTKALIIDDRVSFVGSMNFTKSGNLYNDENVLIIYNKDITAYLKQTFLYLWNKIPDKYLSKDPHPESFSSVGSCFDGVDNDFDGKIDSKDEGCFSSYSK